MTDLQIVQMILDIVQSVGVSGAVLFLYVSEKRSHEETRRQYRADLREIAGFQANIVRRERIAGNDNATN